MERIGIYGGTFNPPHLGHIRAAQQAAEALQLDRLLLVPVYIAPHKQLPEGSPSPEQRLEMLRLAVQGLPKLEVSDLELRRTGPSYTYQTVQELAERNPQAELTLLMGTDMFLSFRNWKNPDEILSRAALGVLYREEREEQAVAAEMARYAPEQVRLVRNTVTAISSTDIRRLLVFRCAEEFLPRAVLDYILSQGLYGTGRDYRRMPMEELEPQVVRLMNPNRVAHIRGCRDTAAELARHWGADPEQAARAGILHDVTKALPASLHLTLCRSYGMIEALAQHNPKTYHELTGGLVAQEIFGEEPEIVSAIRYHTTGHGNMTLLEKIIYIADYIEPNRDFSGVEQLRALAFSDLDAAVLQGLEMNMEQIIKRKDVITPDSLEAVTDLRRKKLC